MVCSELPATYDAALVAIDARTGKPALGRFNWKASQPTVEQQSAVAFSNDMGLSTPLFRFCWMTLCNPISAICLSRCL